MRVQRRFMERGEVALLAEGVDRNKRSRAFEAARCTSPSSRRAWIEISTLRYWPWAWLVALLAEGVDRNLSQLCHDAGLSVALLAEGVDRNLFSRPPSAAS